MSLPRHAAAARTHNQARLNQDVVIRQGLAPDLAKQQIGDGSGDGLDVLCW